MHGAEYLTYVLWAITPEGRTSNLGEILLNGSSGKLNVTTELQVFGLAVTAEPYFAVSMPSNLVVMENVVRKDTKGKIEEMDAKYELLQRGQYERLANPLALKMDSKMPLELYEARNAVQIARATGADRFASETFSKAENSLKQAEAYQARKAGRKPVTMAAREAVQTAEDSRAIAVKRQEEAASCERTPGGRGPRSSAKSRDRDRGTPEGASRKRPEDGGRRRARAEAERNAASLKPRAIKLEAEAARVAAQTEADRVKRERRRCCAKRALRAEADRVKLANDTARDAAQADAELAARTAAQAEADRTLLATQEADRLRLKAEAEKAELRAQLLTPVQLDSRNSRYCPRPDH